MPDTCHILISDGPDSDAFCEMTYLTVSLCKRLYPNSRATVLTDERTATNSPFDFDTLQIEPIPGEFTSNVERSRYLKTTMRQLVEGDFVFLDSDALPLKPFDEITTHGAPFAAALDRNRESPDPVSPQWIVPFYDELSWYYPLDHYYNSGVMFMADSLAMREFSENWHNNWRLLLTHYGVYQDQPSLNHTLQEFDIDAYELPLTCNAMVDASPYFSRGAKIVHYFLRGKDRQPDPISLLAHLIRHIRETDEIDWAAVEMAAETSDAWIHPTNSVHIELATYHYFRAFGLAASRVFLRS
jgi:hypothetical protein